MNSNRWAIIISPEAERELAALQKVQRWRVNGLIDNILTSGEPDGPTHKFVVESKDGKLELVVESVAPFFVILHIMAGVSWE